MRTFRTICLITVLIVAAFAAASAEPVKLEYKYTPGEVSKYRTTMEITAQSAQNGASKSVNATMTTTYKTLEVYPNGSAKVQTTFSAPAVSGSPAKSGTAILKISKQGQILSTEESGTAGSQAAQGIDFSKLTGSATHQVFLPTDPVEVGQSWTQDVPVPFANSRMSATSTLVSADESLWSQKAARIKQNFTGQIDMSEIIKAVASSAGANAQQMTQARQSSGVIKLNGDMVYLFAPAIGKLLTGNGMMQATVSLSLPSQGSKSGSPSSIDINTSIRISITRFK